VSHPVEELGVARVPFVSAPNAFGRCWLGMKKVSDSTPALEESQV